MTHAAAEHYRQIFDRRTPEQLRTLSHLKRFMERLVGDEEFRRALAEAIATPRAVTERYGINVDPMEVLPLWRGGYQQYRFKAESAPWPLAVMWDEYLREMMRHRDLLRDEGEMSTINPRFHAWRERQIRRCNDQLGVSAASLTHPIIAFELSEGCSVGCWFCGLSADRFTGYYDIAKSMQRFGGAWLVSRAKCLVLQSARASATGPQILWTTHTTIAFCSTTIRLRARYRKQQPQPHSRIRHSPGTCSGSSIYIARRRIVSPC